MTNQSEPMTAVDAKDANNFARAVIMRQKQKGDVVLTDIPGLKGTPCLQHTPLAEMFQEYADAQTAALQQRIATLEAVLRFIVDMPNQPDYVAGRSYEADAKMSAFQSLANYAESALANNQTGE